MDDKKYLNFPVPMLKGLNINSKKFFDDIFDIGVYLCSKKLTGSAEKRYNDAKHFLGVTQGCSPKRAIENAQHLLYSMPAKYPITGIEKEMYFDFYKNEKSDYDIICLSAFLGIRSILGKKPYDKTNKSLIHARMFGYVTAKDLPSPLTPLQEKYKIRWHMDKLMEELQVNWHLKVLWNHNRGFYLSFDLSFDEMAAIIEKDKQITKIQQLKELKKKAIEGAKTKTTTH